MKTAPGGCSSQYPPSRAASPHPGTARRGSVLQRYQGLHRDSAEPPRAGRDADKTRPRRCPHRL